MAAASPQPLKLSMPPLTTVTCAVRLIDAREKCRDDLAKLGEDLPGDRTNFDQGMRSHAQKQCLVRLAGAVDADVRLRCGRE